MHKEKVGFGKWLENFWYYYKWHTIIAVILIVGIIVGISSCVSRKKMDLCIYYFSGEPLAYKEDSINLYNSLLPYVSDFTGDGFVRLEIKNYYIGAGNEKDQLQQFTTELQGGTALLILMDQKGLEQMLDTPYLGQITDIAPNVEYDGRIWNADGSDYRACAELEHWTEDMYFGLRVFDENSVIRLIPGKEEEYEYAKGVLTNIINDEKVNLTGKD